MRVSILISTYNGENDIRALLDSIKELEKGCYETEVILRDDSSIDNTVKIVEQEYGWVQLIKANGKNLGFVRSNNIAFQQSTGSLICCVNQDTILHPGFIVEGVRLLQQDQQVVGVNSNMIMPWIMSIEQFRKKDQKEIPAYEYQLTPYGFARYVAVEKTSRQANFMTGGGFFIRRSIIPQNGYLFDPEIDMYCEDTELSLRLQLLGGKIMYCSKAIIYHNQLPRKAVTFAQLVKLIRVTRNRFGLFARINSPALFSLKYPFYLSGILLKMSSLGFSSQKKIIAYFAGGWIAFLFLLLFPYWFMYSLGHRKTDESSRTCGKP